MEVITSMLVMTLSLQPETRLAGVLSTMAAVLVAATLLYLTCAFTFFGRSTEHQACVHCTLPNRHSIGNCELCNTHKLVINASHEDASQQAQPD